MVAEAPPTAHGDAQQILENLIQTTELFDQKNSEYMVMEHKSETSRKVRVHSLYYNYNWQVK